MRAHHLHLLLLSLVASVGCGADPVTPPPPVTPQVVLSSIAVTASASMLVKDDALDLAATGTFSDGSTRDLSTTVQWTSGDDAIATITPAGRVTGRRAGEVEISARLDTVRGATRLTVLPSPVTSVSIEPRAVMMTVGDSADLSAHATLRDGEQRTVTATATWMTTDAAVVTVSAGRLTAVGAGTATITARFAGVSSDGPAIVTVRARPPIAIDVAPGDLTLPLGVTQQYTATARFADGATRDVSEEVTWTASAPAVAEVGDAAGSKGFVRTLTEGFTSIVATHPAYALDGARTLRVSAPEVTAIEVLPRAATVEVNVNQRFTARAVYTNGLSRDVTAALTWRSSNPGVATVSNMAGDHGLAAPVAVGTATISAIDMISGVSSDDSGQSAVLSIVPPRLVSVTVQPPSLTLAAGLSQQLQAFGVRSDNSALDLSGSVMWSSSDPAIATVSASGLLTAVAPGSATLHARDPVSGISSSGSMMSGQVTVTPAVLLSIAVTPATAAMVIGSQQSFIATGTYTNGATIDISTAVTWQSSAPTSLSIDASGLAQALAIGTATVRASQGMINSDATNQSATALISAAQLVSIAVAPRSSTVPPGADRPLVATGLFDNGSQVDLTATVMWSSSSPAVAQVGNIGSGRGVVRAESPGVATISATEPIAGISSDTTGESARVFVPAGVTLTSIAVTPAAATIGVNEAQVFTAAGTFSDASTHPVSQSVTWASANMTVASISNTDGTRGRATGLATGTAVISATHPPSGVSSAINGVLTVQRSIQIAQLLHYEVEAGSGTTLSNLAPGGVPGVINGAATWGSPGGAAASNFYLRMPTGTANVNPQLATSATHLTIEFWWRYQSGSGTSYMWNLSSTFRAFTNGVALNGIMVRSTPGGADVAYTTDLQDQSWHHVAYVLDATALEGRLYVDGAQVGSTPYSGSINLTGLIVLGQASSNSATVDFDRYRIWSEALTAAQVSEAFLGQR